MLNSPYTLDQFYDGASVPPAVTNPFKVPTMTTQTQPLPYPTVTTGGNTPPLQVAPGMVTGGNTPPLPYQQLAVAPQTGGNTPPLPYQPAVAPQTGGNLPPVVSPWQSPQLSGNTPPLPVQGQNPPPGSFLPLPPSTPFQSPDPALAGKSVQDNLAALLGPNSPYIQNARQRGLEVASSRGLLNSSMAADSSERAAIESAMPILAETMGLQGTREGMRFTGQQNQFNRELQQNLQREQYAFQGEQSGLSRNHDFDMAQVKDWLDTNSFSREFYGTLSMMPIKSTTDLMAQLQTYAIDNPEVYTPEVMNGMGQFFSQNMMQLLAQYWPDIYGQQTAATPSGGA